MRNFICASSFIFFFIVFHAPLLFAASNNPAEISDLDLESLMNVKIEGATLEKYSLAEAPATVTVFTSKDIQRIGARSLIDVLNLIPGLSVATDTQGVLGIAVRGMWAHEGKTLLLIDGEEMNELSFNTFPLGNNFPIDTIERIEFIKGPGSAVHGGYAELATINIITKSGKEVDGIVLNGNYGQMQRTYGERNGGIGFGKSFQNWDVSSYFSAGEGHQSDREYTDSQGSKFDFRDNGKADPIYANLGVDGYGLHLKGIYTRYKMTDRTAYGTNTIRAFDDVFEGIHLGAKYEVRPISTLSVVPEFHFHQNKVWNETDDSAKAVAQLFYDTLVQEYRGGISTRWQPLQNLVAYFGVEGRIQNATDRAPGSVFKNGLTKISYYRNAVFSELNWNPEFANFSAGGRYESQNIGGGQIVPRLSVTKAWGGLHSKLIYSWGFRQPGVENLRFNPALKPELTKVAEAEVGYQWNKFILSNLNLYNVTLDRPIIYNYSGTTQSYRNASMAGTYGFETALLGNFQWFDFNLNYSYFKTRASEPTDYAVPDHPETLLGMANHKVGMNANVRLWDQYTRLNLSNTFYSKRFGYEYNAALGAMKIKDFSEAFLVNAYLEREHFFFDGLSAGLGVFNILNQDFRYIQPYNGSHPSVPSPSREVVAKAEYKIHL